VKVGVEAVELSVGGQRVSSEAATTDRRRMNELGATRVAPFFLSGARHSSGTHALLIGSRTSRSALTFIAESVAPPIDRICATRHHEGAAARHFLRFACLPAPPAPS
jgi:hypothetical protein